jgi:hypothetical protein
MTEQIPQPPYTGIPMPEAYRNTPYEQLPPAIRLRVDRGALPQEAPTA